jgi:signal peptidase I
MELKFWKKKVEQKPKSFVREWWNSIVFAVVVATFIRWSAVQAFVIPTPSMENTLLVGDYLFVSKLHYGPQTPRTPLQIPLTHQKIWGTNIPSYLPWIQLPTYRFPGFAKIKNGDVVVFNVPPVKLNEGIDYPNDLKTNYVKRCVGIPGDRLQVVDRQVRVNGRALAQPEAMKLGYLVAARDEISSRVLRHLGIDGNDQYFLGRSRDEQAVYRMFLTDEQVTSLKSIPFIKSVMLDYTRQNGEDDIFPALKAGIWSGDNYGPIVIPAKGMTMLVNDSTLGFYGEIITRYDDPGHAAVMGKNLMVGGVAATTYTFRQDYYFMMGDNRHNSLDSRYWGFVPGDHIVGKPLFVFMSLDEEADWLHKVRWNRLLRLIR